MNAEDEPQGVGQRLIHFIVESGLFAIECPDESVPLVIWSANAAEQIEAFLADSSQPVEPAE